MRNAKIAHKFMIEKPKDVKQTAFLLEWFMDKPMTRNEAGMLVVELEDLTNSCQYSAWTTLSAAKRIAAQKVGRSRLTWSDVSTDEAILWKAEYEEKVK